MQKVVGSSPIIRFKIPAKVRVLFSALTTTNKILSQERSYGPCPKPVPRDDEPDRRQDRDTELDPTNRRGDVVLGDCQRCRGEEPVEGCCCARSRTSTCQPQATSSSCTQGGPLIMSMQAGLHHSAQFEHEPGEPASI